MNEHFSIPVPVKPYVKAYMEREYLPEKRMISPFSGHHVNALIYSVLDNRAMPFFPKKAVCFISFYLSMESARRRKASSLGQRGRKMAEGIMTESFKKATYDQVLASMMDGSNKNEGLHCFRERYAIYEDMYSFKSHLQALDRYSEPLPMKLNTRIRSERLDRMYYEVKHNMIASTDPRKNMRSHIRDFYAKYPDMKEIMTEERAWQFIKQFKTIRRIHTN
jgi:hypothetical protein